jgi:transposase
MRVSHAIDLEADVRRKLEQQARGRSTAARVVLRSRIVLLAADGLQNKQIAAALNVAPRMVTLWRGRFLELGIEGLLKDAPRPGRTPSITTEVTAALIAKTTQSTPANATHWSTRTMAREMGVSKASVSRIWRANGLKPHRVESFKVSNDPLFADKLDAIVGLYLNPPEHALVLSVDAKSQIQALDRTQPGLPIKEGPGRHHDARLQAQRHDHLVCCVECRQWRGLRPVPAEAPPSGVAEVSAHDRSDCTGRKENLSDLR